jgi:hypothetical protein
MHLLSFDIYSFDIFGLRHRIVASTVLMISFKIEYEIMDNNRLPKLALHTMPRTYVCNSTAL